FVQLMWDNRADRMTREPFLNGANDFEGYKVFRSTDPDMKDPQVITDGFGTETLMKPIFQCDLKNGIRGFTDYGLLNGMAYNLGNDTGLAYSFRDETIQNGRTYYYAIIAYDYGIHPDSLKGTSIIAQGEESGERYGIAPSENNVVIRKNEFEEIEFIGPNVAIVTPGTNPAGEYVESSFEVIDTGNIGQGQISPQIIDMSSLKQGHTYKVKFQVNVIDSSYRFHSGYGYKYTSGGLKVYDQTNGDELVFEDVLIKGQDGDLVPKNMNSVLVSYDNETATGDDDFYHIETADIRQTEIFDGMLLNVKMANRLPEYDYINSGWMPGAAPINIVFVPDGIEFYGWDYNIVFYDEPVYSSVLDYARAATLRDENNVRIERDQLLFDLKMPITVQNINFVDSTGQPPLFDLVAQDLNGDGQFSWLDDRVLVGPPVNDRGRWDDVIFMLDFHDAASADELPKGNDVYAMRFSKPWWQTDSILFTVSAEKLFNAEAAKSTMDSIRVVPNPYVASNLMESSVVNKYLNQGRRLLFTNLPELCTIKIFTVSGVLIRELRAPDDALTGVGAFGTANNGMLHWDMLTKEGLEIAAGMYFYHVKDDRSGEEKSGKFAVIK
ncbi:hypothetical protein JXA02_14060, partial [candidate division KSB1 bacterium]|nr:hypothetical protein [candidate division KSB1 bacterium]